MVADAGQLQQADAGRLQSTAMMAASRRCANPRPAHARSKSASSLPVKTGTSFPVTFGGCSPAIGSGRSSSADSHLNNCCSAWYWLEKREFPASYRQGGVREIGRVGFAAGETVVRVGELESLDQPRANQDQSSATGVSVLMG
jgi:hypothetical protein